MINTVMQLFEVIQLLEYNQQATLNKWGERIAQAATFNEQNMEDNWFYRDSSVENEEQLATAVLKELESIDPTPNKQYVMTLVRWYTAVVKVHDQNTKLYAKLRKAELESGWADDWEDGDFWPEDYTDLGTGKYQSPGYVTDRATEDWNIEGVDFDIQNMNGKSTFKLEDAEQIRDALERFEHIKPQLQPNERDIGRYKSFYRFEDFVDEAYDENYVPPETDNKTLKRSDVEVLYNGPLGTVTIPRSHEASCLLGSGTKWCTAGKSSHFYDSYSSRGDLIIYNEKPGNAKYQIHPTLDSTEIMDARDRPVSNEKFKEFTGSHPVLSKLIKQKQLKAFTDAAQEDPEWDLSRGPDTLDDMIERVHYLIKKNNKQRVGVMTYVETYYTQEFFKHRHNKRNHIGEHEMDFLVKYSEQRGKPWPEIQPLVVAYIQKQYEFLPTDDSIKQFKAQNQAPSFPADAQAASDLKDIRKQAQATFKTAEAKQLLILIKQFKRLKNPWPELDAIQAQLEGKGISFGPGDMNVENKDMKQLIQLVESADEINNNMNEMRRLINLVESAQLNELMVRLSSDRKFQRSDTYKNYLLYVTKEKFKDRYYISKAAHSNGETFKAGGSDVKASGASQLEALDNLRDVIDELLNATKVSRGAIIDFNVQFVKQLTVDPEIPFYAHFDNIKGEPVLVIAGDSMLEFGDELRQLGFKRSAIRTRGRDEFSNTTPLPSLTFTASQIEPAGLIANARYIIGDSHSDRDGNTIYELTYHSTVHTSSDKRMLNVPALTVGTER